MSRTRVLSAIAVTSALVSAVVGFAAPAQAATKPTGSVAVQLVDVNGAPLALPGYTVGSDAFGGTVEEATTDSAGRATLDGIITGGYEIFASNWARQPDVYAPAQRYGVVVTANTITSIAIVMAHGAEVSGRVVRPDGSPLADTAVSIMGQAEVAEGYSVKTDAVGRYSFTGLQSDAYEISSSITGGPATASWVTRVYQERRGVAPSDVTLAARTVHTSSDLSLGIAVAPDPAALVGATVRLTNTATGATFDQRTSGALAVQQSLSFDVPSGSYTVQVRTVATPSSASQIWWSRGASQPMTPNPVLAQAQRLDYSSQVGLFLRFPAS